MNDSLLKIVNVKKSFGDHLVHRGISIDLKQGETLGLLGNSGSGKSVLLRSLIGLEHIDAGEIYFENKRIDNLTEDQFMSLRVKISYSFQYGALFDSINVFENLAYPLFEHTDWDLNKIEKTVAEMLAIIDLPGKGHLMPSELSGGMQKRVGLARAVILNPKIILYDEPTAGLDPTNTTNILKIMEKFKKNNIASIFVTHDIPSALRVCDRICIIDQGKVGYSGTPAEILKSSDPLVKKFFSNINVTLPMESQ